MTQTCSKPELIDDWYAPPCNNAIAIAFCFAGWRAYSDGLGAHVRAQSACAQLPWANPLMGRPREMGCGPLKHALAAILVEALRRVGLPIAQREHSVAAKVPSQRSDQTSTNSLRPGWTRCVQNTVTHLHMFPQPVPCQGVPLISSAGITLKITAPSSSPPEMSREHGTGCEISWYSNGMYR